MKTLRPLIAMALLAGAPAASAQSFHGSIRGTITEAGSGPVSGAVVTLASLSTAIARRATAGELGEYAFADVDPDRYTLTVAAAGYRTVRLAEITVATYQAVTIDLALERGDASEVVIVTADAPAPPPTRTTVLDSRSLQTLPASGRNAFMLAASIPTVIPSGDAQFNRQQDQTNASLLSLGGGVRRSNSYTLDGVPITDLRNRAIVNPTLEAVDDVAVIVRAYSAAVGRTGGGAFNATLKSGSNEFRGTGFFQTRPVWAQSQNYFSQRAGVPKPDSPYHLAGGAIGGPLARNRTFFWFAAEGYRDVQTRTVSVTLPTAAERAGDFSALRTADGRPVTLYDPLTTRLVDGVIVRDPFPGNRIPRHRIDPVAAAMLDYLPLPDRDIDDGTLNYTRTALMDNRLQQQYVLKLDHRLTDAATLSGFYVYNRTNEPDAAYFEPHGKGAHRFADPNDYLLKRRPQIAGTSTTIVLDNTSVLTLRGGITRMEDSQTLTARFDPAALGFSPNFLSEIPLRKFPSVRIRGYDQGFSAPRPNGLTMGAIDPTDVEWRSANINGSYTRLTGAHQITIGADGGSLALDSFTPGPGAGFFDFDRDFTSARGDTTDLTSGNAFAAFLLGYPSGLASRRSTLPVSSPLNVFTRYYGAYLQDEWRVRPDLSITMGLRAEHETGLREEQDRFTVGFDSTMRTTLSGIAIPADPVAGSPVRHVQGGLMYPGVDGNSRHQGNPPAVRWSPRAGLALGLSARTTLRGGYGLYWSPFAYPPPNPTANNYGQVGFTQNTTSPQTSPVPTVTLTDPFPAGVVHPTGSSRGGLSGVGTSISFVDQHRSAPRVQQYSIELQRQLPANMSASLSYLGARGDRLPLGGSSDTPININQLDPKYLALGPALAEQVPNPFAGLPAFAGTGLGSSRTVARAQLLRPFPQFLDVHARQVTEGVSRYDAVVLEWERRQPGGVSWRASYTYSAMRDNLVGEGNFYSVVTPGLPLNHYNYLRSMPRCAAGAELTTACYAPRSEYGRSILDVPHRLVVAPVIELRGGWSVAALWTVQSGFPISVQQPDNTGLFGGAQRPSLTGVELKTQGGYEDRLASTHHRAATWINPAAFAPAAPYTFGTAPRTITDVRTPSQRVVDISIAKTTSFGRRYAAQLKVEVFNLFNRVAVRAFPGANMVGTPAFGRITNQAGFMRMAQVTLRLSI